MDGDAPEPIEVELTSHEPPPERTGRWGREPASAVPLDGTNEGPPESEPGGSGGRPDVRRVVLVASVTAVLAMTLGVIIGRATTGDPDTVADDSSEIPSTAADAEEPTETLPIVGDEIDDPDFEGDDPVVVLDEPVFGGATGDDPASTEVVGPTTEPIGVDARLAGVPVRLVGVELGGVLVEVDLAAGTLTDFGADRIVSDGGGALVVGSDWVVASLMSGRIIWSDGSESTLARGDWRLLAVPGAELFWRGSFGPGSFGSMTEPGELELVDFEGQPLGPVIETPPGSWPLLVDPRSGGVVVVAAGRSYVVLEGGVEYLGAGEVIAMDEDTVVTYDCDEALVCSLYRTDRTTGDVTIVPPDPRFDEPLRWDSMAVWGAADASISPDGRWVAVVALQWRSSVFGIVDLATGRFVELTEFSPSPSIAWSPDGRWAFYVDGQVPTAYDTVAGEGFPIFTDMVQWLQLGARPPSDVDAAANGPTLLSAAPQEPVEG